MKGLPFSEQTRMISVVFLTLYFVYGLFYIPFQQFLVCLAIGAIATGITDSYEIGIISVLASNFVFPIFFKNYSYKREGFVDSPEAEEEEAKEKGEPMPPFGVGLSGVGSGMTEGFEDAQETDLTLSETKKKSANSEGALPVSKPADLASAAANIDPAQMEKMTGMVKSMMASMNKETDVLKPAAAKTISEDGVPPAHQPQEKETFQDNSGLFKLGQLPKDEKGGFHIDAGTTVMNAINALKPDQIKAMTMDTKQLIETQKSLMGMLQTFQPMVSEGKQMMETFQEMFSPTMGATPGAMAAAPAAAAAPPMLGK